MKKHKRKKNRIKFVIEQIIKMAKERYGVRWHNSSFIQTMLNEVQGSAQKAFDKIFELALERHQELYHKGQAPRLIPEKYITPSPIARRLEGFPSTAVREQIIERETRETEKITRERIINMEIVKALFPDDLQDLLKFEFKGRNAILRTRHWIDREDWKAIHAIIDEHGGKWVRKAEKSHWQIPIHVSKSPRYRKNL